MPLTLSLQDSFKLHRDGETIELKNRKAQALLVYLALTGKPHSREHLATLLWGDRFDEQARNSLRQALHALRKATGPDVVIGEEELSVTPGAFELDLSEAALLPGFRSGSEAFDDWLVERRQYQRTQLANRLIRQAQQSLARQDESEALENYLKTLQIDPLNEEVVRHVMTILGRLDRRPEALAYYQVFSDRLKAELDAKPGSETEALAMSLRQDREPAAQQSDHPNALIVPFENLGGGDLADFIASDMADEIAIRVRSLGLVTIDLPAQAAAEIGSSEGLLPHARKIGAQCMITGTARQFGDKVRVSIRLVSVAGGTSGWTHRAIIHSDEVFDRIGELGSHTSRHVYEMLTRLQNSSQLVAQLKQETGRPEAFLATWNSLYWKAFFVEQTRAHLTQVAELAKFAHSHFPKNPFVIGTHALAQFHLAHISDHKDRLARYREADNVLQSALAINANLALVHSTNMIISTWLGRNDVVDRVFDHVMSSGTNWHATAGLRMPSLAFRNRNHEVLELAETVMQNESGSPLLFYRFAYLGLAHFNLENHSEALRNARNALEWGREFFMGHLVKIASLERLGHHEEAALALDDMRLDYRDPTVTEFEFLPYEDAALKRKLLDALKDAGMPN